MERGSLSVILIIITLVFVIGTAIFFSREKAPIENSPIMPTNEPQSKNVDTGLKFDNEALKISSNQVFLAPSPDGINFEKGNLAFDQASSPDIVRLPSGRLLAYLVDGAGRSKSGLIVALSDDGGKTWDQGSVQLKTFASSPDIVLLGNGNLRLYFLTAGAIKSATSSDGINFEIDEGIRFKSTTISSPDVIRIGEKYFMYLTQGQRLISAISDDGINFALKQTIREKGTNSNTVYVDVNFYRQFYCLNGDIKSDKTTDGITFTPEPDFRMTKNSQTVCDVSTLHLGGSWLMLYNQTK